MENIRIEAANDQPFVTLNDGSKMPMIGLGSFLSSEGDVYPVIKAAILEHGYRHIDTASFYNNEDAIGRALQECFATGQIKREDVFITTKLHYQEKDDPIKAIKQSLEKLKLDYVDLYLVHWPIPKMDYEAKTYLPTPMYKVWEMMEQIKDLGLSKSIGVSNMTIPMLIDMLAYCRIKPSMN